MGAADVRRVLGLASPGGVTGTRRHRRGLGEGLAPTGGASHGNHYDVVMISLFGSLSALSLVDLATTIRAYAAGLSEGNYLLLDVSRTLGLGTLWTLVAFKVAFIAGLGLVVTLGVGTRSPNTRAAALGLMATFTAVLLFVSFNNLYWISS